MLRPRRWERQFPCQNRAPLDTKSSHLSWSFKGFMLGPFLVLFLSRVPEFPHFPPIATMISLDEISFYQPCPNLPDKPAPPFKPPSATPKSLPSLHPLPQKPNSQTNLPLNPVRPQRSQHESSPASTRHQRTSPMSPCANDFDMALAAFDNMTAGGTGRSTVPESEEQRHDRSSNNPIDNPTKSHPSELTPS